MTCHGLGAHDRCEVPRSCWFVGCGAVQHFGVLDCLVVLVCRGCAACGVNDRALLNPAQQLAMLGRAVGWVWGSARALRPTWHFARWHRRKWDNAAGGAWWLDPALHGCELCVQRGNPMRKVRGDL